MPIIYCQYTGQTDSKGAKMKSIRLLVGLAVALTVTAACNGGEHTANQSSTTSRVTTTREQAAKVDTVDQELLYNYRANALFASTGRCELATEHIDPYVFIGYDPKVDPRTQDDGSRYTFDCTTRVEGWFFKGKPGDAWQPLPVKQSQIEASGEHTKSWPSLEVPLGEVYPVAPDNAPSHPGYSQAVGLNDLKVGKLYCAYIIPDRGPANPQFHYTSQIDSGAYGRALLLRDLVVSDPLIKEHQVGIGGTPQPLNLVRAGVLPRPDGLWTRSHMEAGACPEG